MKPLHRLYAAILRRQLAGLPMPKHVAMKISFAALDRIPLSTNPRNPTANANANAAKGTPGAVAG